MRHYKYLVTDIDRHGNRRLYVKKRGLPKVRIKASPDDPRAFSAAYSEAMARLEVVAPEKPSRSAAPSGTLGWLAAQYFRSPEFAGFPPQSQSNRRGIIEGCLREPLHPGSKDTLRFLPLRLVAAVHIRMVRDRKRDLKGAANNRLKYLSSMFTWAIEHDPPLMRGNPCRDVKSLRNPTSGFHTWTADEVSQFESRWAPSTKPRLAMALMYYLGVRRQDAIVLGRQHVRQGAFHFVPQKTDHVKADPVVLPVPAELTAIIEAAPRGGLTFLLTEHGKPFTVAGFGNWFRDRCRDAGLTRCTAHGLRKARATILAERGATDRQLMAVFGWSSEKEATKYTRAASRKKLAAAAMALKDEAEGVEEREAHKLGPTGESHF